MAAVCDRWAAKCVRHTGLPGQPELRTRNATDKVSKHVVYTSVVQMSN